MPSIGQQLDDRLATADAKINEQAAQIERLKAGEVEMLQTLASMEARVKALEDGGADSQDPDIVVTGLENGNISNAVVVTADVPGEDIESISFYVDGKFVRTERFSPYSLGSDQGADKLIPWDSTTVDDGHHVLHAVAKLKDGREISTAVGFNVVNSKPPVVTPVPPDPSRPDPGPIKRVIQLRSGEHRLTQDGWDGSGWTVYEPAPGVDPEKCVIVDVSRYDGMVALRGMTQLFGNARPFYGNGPDAAIWLDDMTLWGLDPLLGQGKTPYLFQAIKKRVLMTDCRLDRIIQGFQNLQGTHIEAYGIEVGETFEDLFKSSIRGRDITAKKVGVNRHGARRHPDVVQVEGFVDLEDVVVGECTAQAITSSNLRDSRFINVHIPPSNEPTHNGLITNGPLVNVLFRDCTLGRSIILRGYNENVVFENCDPMPKKQTGVTIR